VIVANSGAWVPPDSVRSIGSGIQTLRKRLGLLLGPAATAEVVCEEGWVKIVIRLPDTGQRGDHPILPAITA
jgi:LytS/YehU family sensor histidine kinase